MNSSRTPLIAGNWKMYRGGADGVALAHAVGSGSRDVKGVHVVVSPPFTALAAVAATLHEIPGNRVEVSAQNFYPKAEGAFTGEVSAPMLLESGCQWVIIGHSERRQFFGETDASVHDKTVAAIAAGLRPIVCVGESLEERESGRTLEVVFRQLDAFSADLAGKPGYGVIAYEPVWAIGTGKVAGPDQAQEAHQAIRQRLAGVSATVAEKTLILYGGSCKPDNAAKLLDCPDVDGALVGGASLEAESFLKIIRAGVAG
jgi:triosephosphate isomerase (TIM)